MNIISKKAVKSLSVIFWKNQPVITTELLASVYGADTNNIKQNFSRNASRFVEGQHYFKLTGSNLKEFSLQVTNSHSQNLQAEKIDLQISNMTRSLILWTERGTVRHAKMLGTDKAWEVQDELETFYFTHKTPPPLSTPEQRETLNSIIELSLINIELVKCVLDGQYIAKNEWTEPMLPIPDSMSDFVPCDLDMDSIINDICSDFKLASSFKIAINLRLLKTTGISPSLNNYTKRHLPAINIELQKIKAIIQTVQKNHVLSELDGIRLLALGECENV